MPYSPGREGVLTVKIKYPLEVMQPISVIDTGEDIYKSLSELQELYRQAGTDFSSDQLDELIDKAEEIRNMIIT